MLSNHHVIYLKCLTLAQLKALNAEGKLKRHNDLRPHKTDFIP